MDALWDTDVPVPRVRLIGTSDDPLGLPCHVTDFVDGVVIDSAPVARSALSPEALRSASVATVEILAALHAVEPTRVGLGDLGPANDYGGRQVRRWLGLLDSLASDDSSPDPAAVRSRASALRSIGLELGRRLPTDGGGRIVHGDYRLGNCITGPDGGIRAVLDWELVTLGEPLADLGMLLIYWNPPPEALLGKPAPTSAPGAISETEVADIYADLTGAGLDGVHRYQSLACWRLACLCLRTAMRFASGAMGTDAESGAFLTTTEVWTELARGHLVHR